MLPAKPFAKGFDPLALIAAEQSGSQVDFDSITRIGAAKLVNPQAAYNTEFFPCPPPPPVASAASLVVVGGRHPSEVATDNEPLECWYERARTRLFLRCRRWSDPVRPGVA